jgi:ATP-dependent DNA helicase RecG
MNFKNKKESETLELKKSVGDWKEIIETISAFSNTRGGEILVGINNSGEVNGIEIGKNTIEDLTNKIKENTDPEIYPRIATRTINNKTIIVVRVRESNNHLVLAFGRPFKRIGKSTVRMSKDEYERLVLEKHKEKLYFDSQICEGATIEDIDEEKIKWFLRKVKEARNLNIEPTISLKEALMKLNLLVDNKLTKAAILIFGKSPQKYFIQSEVRCARFKGIKAVKPFIDMKVIGGSVYEQIDQTEKFVLFNIKKSAWIETGKIERQERWEYPPDAIREAITNAIAHRDYNSSANVHISIYDDRVEIWNPGRLPQPLTPDDLKKEHKSIPINPSLANLLFLTKYIERWGTGTNDIIKWCKEYELPEPVFKEAAGGFAVILRKLHISEDLESIELNERQKKAVEFLKEKGKISNREYVNLLKSTISGDTALNDLRDMVKKGIISVKRKGRSSYYIIR